MYLRAEGEYKCLVVTCPRRGASGGVTSGSGSAAALLWDGARHCGEPVMLGRSFSRFCGCRRALAREQVLDGAIDVPRAELRVWVPVMMAPGLEAFVPARDG